MISARSSSEIHLFFACEKNIPVPCVTSISHDSGTYWKCQGASEYFNKWKAVYTGAGELMFSYVLIIQRRRGRIPPQQRRGPARRDHTVCVQRFVLWWPRNRGYVWNASRRGRDLFGREGLWAVGGEGPSFFTGGQILRSGLLIGNVTKPQRKRVSGLEVLHLTFFFFLLLMDKLESVYEVYKSLTWVTLVWLHNRTNTVDREGRKTPACTSLHQELYNVVLLHGKGSALQHYGSRGALNFHDIPVRSRALCLAVCLLNGTTCRQKSDIWQCKVWIVETLFPQAEFCFTPCQHGAGNRVGGKMHKSPLKIKTALRR